MSYYKHNDLDIYYTIDGDIKEDKPIIVILNGIMMSSLSWELFTDAFTKNNILVRYDMIDQGKTSTVDYQYTQELQLEVLKGLLDHLQLSRVNLVGISYGASIALQFAVKFPNYIEKMVVANVVAKTSPWLKSIGDGWNKVGKTRDGEAYYHISIPYIYSPQFYQKRLTWMENRKKILVPIFSDPDFLDAMERKTISAETHDVRNELPNIKIDTLIISSKEDYLTPMYEQEYIHNNMPNSKLVLLQECGHASMYEKPTQFTELVLGHINNKISIKI